MFKHIIIISALSAIAHPHAYSKGPENPKPSQADSTAPAGGLENILVETYYFSDSHDSTDVDGGHLPAGSVTYRIYVDMLPGYKLKAVYGVPGHELKIATTTFFFNNIDRGVKTADGIAINRLVNNTVALDSWVSVGAGSKTQYGVMKEEDTDGSIVGGSHNDGGSQGTAGGLLVNNNSAAGIPLTTADGLMPGTVPAITIVSLDLSVFDNQNAGPSLISDDGAWSCLEGAQGPTASNKVLIAQLTTNGTLTFELNIQLQSPEGEIEQYVSAVPQGSEILFPALSRH